MSTILKTGRALSALDLSVEFARLEAIGKERKETAAAYDRGKAKTIDLSQQLAKIREPHRDGQAEAKALRAGTDVAGRPARIKSGPSVKRCAPVCRPFPAILRR